MEFCSYQIDELIKQKIESFYSDYKLDNNGDYIVFFAKYEKITITIYQSKKGFKVLFSGPNCLNEARLFNPEATLGETKEKIKTNFIDYSSQIGSDEVGFGDFFGPLVVVACYFDESLISEASKLNDSKKITDEFILEYIPTILDKIIFSKLTVQNTKYNQLIDKGYNMSEIKAKLHNQALLNVKKKIPNAKKIYIDQFCDPDIYYHYLAFEPEIVDNIVFKTKGESYFPSVALASMVARYCFLKEFEQMNIKYDMVFPKGAGVHADYFAQKFIERYGIEKMREVCKVNFTNYKQIVNN